MSKITPCIWFDDQAEEAAQTYLAAFGGQVRSVSRYGEGMPRPAGSVMAVELELAGHSFQALNGGPMFKLNPSISFFAHADSADEAARMFGHLAAGGKVLMPLDAYPWSPCFGWVEDRFGVSWQIITGRRPASGATLAPCLMFSDAQRNRAEAAIQAYCEVFREASRVDSLERYQAGEGVEGTIKHGRFTLAGQDFVAMDSPVDHGFTFNEAVSLSVSCADQAEVDRLWDALTEGGSPGPCGWLKDRFGVSWQIVPERFVALHQAGDERANARMFEAMFAMERLDLAALERAYRGETI